MPKGVLSETTPRCVATAHGSGERCKLPAIHGGTVCRRHGGSTKHVQRKARERFNDSIDPMINVTARYMKEAEEGKLAPMEALAWAKFVADRTGFIAGKVNVNVDGPPLWEGVLTGIIREAPEDIIDATIVYDGIDESDAEENPLERHEREEAEKRAEQRRDMARDEARRELGKEFTAKQEERRRGIDPPKRWDDAS